jgi:predicted nucleotidyltransferase
MPKSEYFIQSNKLLSDIKALIISEYPSAEIIFYGSRSRGHEENYADWDILILTDENLTENKKIELHNKIFDIELANGEIIHAVIHAKKEWQDPLMQITPFHQNVMREGIPI